MKSEPGLAVAVDIGGTFTDVALADPASGRIWRAKTPSVPEDPSLAFIDGVKLALAEAGQGFGALTQVLHGTTVATNMILEGKGVPTALVTTRGFRHVLTIGRQDIPRGANLYTWVKPARPVRPAHVLEVAERIGAGGAVLEPLDEESVAGVIETLRAAPVRSVAVCLLHAFANPAHEHRVAEAIRAALPDIAVTASSEVLPVIREFERSMTTVLNATVKPGVSSYVGRLEARLAAEGVAAPLLLMQSNGGVAGAEAIRRAPALTALSGPAAGVVGARAAATACGIDDIITVDIGGTSADICLIKDGRIGLTDKGAVGEWPLSMPMVDMVTVGAGGGSIARILDGALTVGPESAGAVPGPAAYGRGGTEPTVTDAHVVLGHLPRKLLGGRMDLDFDAARTAVETRIAAPLGIPVEAAARGILAVADNRMVGAMRVVSVERGLDPRRFTLVPFGGAGPLHGCALARLLGIRRILIASAPGVLCADGLLAADLRAEFSRALPRAGALDMAEAEAIFSMLEAEAIARLNAEQVADADRTMTRVGLFRYRGQGGELAVPFAATAAETEAAFAAAHQALYGFVMETPVELVSLRVEAVGQAPERPAAMLNPGPVPEAIGKTRIDFGDGTVDVPIHDRATLGAGTTLAGPAVLSQLDSTILIAPGWQAAVHQSGAIILTDGDQA